MTAGTVFMALRHLPTARGVTDPSWLEERINRLIPRLTHAIGTVDRDATFELTFCREDCVVTIGLSDLALEKTAYWHVLCALKASFGGQINPFMSGVLPYVS